MNNRLIVLSICVLCRGIGYAQNKDALRAVNMGSSVNSRNDDYSAAEVKGHLYFTSRRPVKGDGKEGVQYAERIFYVDTFTTALTKAVEAPKKLRSGHHISVAGGDSAHLYYYEGKTRFGDIYRVTFTDKGKLKTSRLPKKISAKSTTETTVSFDSSGNAYFVSARRGGEGRKDIWYAACKKGNSYAAPVNLGPVINTAMDEEGVWVTPDGNTLYFSSTGHSSVGDFDVFKSVRDDNGAWGEPVALGVPVNSEADDLFYRGTSDPELWLLSSNREGGLGGFDLYLVQPENRPTDIYSEPEATEVEDTETK